MTVVFKNFLKSIFLICLLSNSDVVMAEMVFHFHMTHMSAIRCKDIVPDTKRDVTFNVYIYDNGSAFVGMKTNGNGFKVGEFSGKWFVNDLGFLEIKEYI